MNCYLLFLEMGISDSMNQRPAAAAATSASLEKERKGKGKGKRKEKETEKKSLWPRCAQGAAKPFKSQTVHQGSECLKAIFPVLNLHVHCSIIYNSQGMEAIQRPIDGQANKKKAVVPICDGIHLGHKKE